MRTGGQDRNKTLDITNRIVPLSALTQRKGLHMKLARLLAMQITKWPVKIGCGIHPVDAITQGVSGDIYVVRKVGSSYAYPCLHGTLKDIAEDAPLAYVTFEQWQLARARLEAESWNGHKDTDPPMHAFCVVVEGNCNWSDYDKRLIGMRAEIIGKSITTYGTAVYAVELNDGTTYNLIRKCLVRAMTEEEQRAEDVDVMAKQLFSDCRKGTADHSAWDFCGDPLRNMYRNAIKAGWVKP